MERSFLSLKETIIIILTAALLSVLICSFSSPAESGEEESSISAAAGYTERIDAGDKMQYSNDIINYGTVNIPCRGSADFTRGIYYSAGNSLTYCISISDGNVCDLELSIYYPFYYDFGIFNEMGESGKGYISVSELPLGSGYYMIRLKNQGSDCVEVDSLIYNYDN